MADLQKFEKMLELLVNEDKAAAQELFHEIVVEKSRDIYESLLEDEDEVDEATDEEVDEATDEEVDEASDEEVDESDEDLDENFSLDTFEVEADDAEADDEAGDMPDMGDEEEGDEESSGDVEDRVEDLEDALDDLKAEFEKLMAGEEGEEAPGDDMDMGGDATDDMMGDLGMDDEEPKEDTESDSFQATITPLESKVVKSSSEQMREYVEKVSATMGDNGAATKSIVAKPNNMGGTTANLKGGESKAAGTQGGLAAPTPRDMNTKNVNVPGAKGATKMNSTSGHGAEKKASGDNGVNTKPVIGK
jgi:E3 ubiquitin-protein ligase HUWE1